MWALLLMTCIHLLGLLKHRISFSIESTVICTLIQMDLLCLTLRATKKGLDNHS